MATLATETWTGTTGAAWPTQWINGSQQGTATIQSNAGRMLSDGNGYRRVQKFLNVPAVGKCQIYIEVTLSATTENGTWVFLRSDSTQTDAAYPTGYGVVLNPADGSVYTLELGYGSGESLQQTYPLTYTAGAKYGILLAADGATFMSKVWNLTGSQPAAWQLTQTDPDNAWPTGRVELMYTSGNAANPGTTFDNMTYTDGAAASSKAGAMMLAF